MNQSVFADMIKQAHGRLDRPLFLVALALLLFVVHFSLVSHSLDFFSPYNFRGMWITIPDFDKGINDPDSALTRIYYRLNGWDGQWYYHIATNGYQCDSIPESNNPHTCNIAFFPLVPMLGNVLSLTGLDLVYALPLVSQLFYLSSILLLLFFIRSMGAMRPIHLLPVLLFMAYPGSLYHFTPYSESSVTFLTIALFTLSHWQLQKPTIGKWCLLVIAGFTICLAKANGVMALCIPVLMAFFSGWHERKFFTNVQIQLYAAAAAGSLGLVSFLIYSELRFGQWNIYFTYLKQGWTLATENGLQSPPVTLLSKLNPVAILSKFHWPEHLSGQVANFLFLFMLPVIAGLAFVTWKDQGRQRFVALTALCMIILYFYFYSSLGKSIGAGVTNFVRHLVPTMGIAAILLIAARPGNPQWLSTRLLVSFVVAFLAVGFYFQKQLLDLFRYGYWVS